MADRVINVTVSNVNTKNVTVSSKQVANEISATADSSVYYSQLAKNWAIGEGLIQNEDYSSKTYAGVAQEAAESAQGSADTAQAFVNDFSGVVDNAITEIDGVKTEALTAVTSSKDLALSDISATQSSALTEIGDLKNSSLTEISASSTTALGNINNVGQNYIDNINATGKGYDNLTQRQITNCLLEVPQRIKYDLTDGVLTIKAGSVVIVPYGIEDLTAQYPVGTTFLNDNFKVADTQFADGRFFVWAELVEDVVRNAISTTNTTERWAFLRIDANGYDAFGTGVSGTEAVTNSICYRTDLNKCVCYNTSGAVKSEACCLPFMKVLANGIYVEGSVTQLFNGMGYIGSTVWVDKGVKGLISNRRNEDDSLKNVEFTTNKLVSYTFANTLTYANLLPCLYMDFPNNSSIVFDGEIKGLDYITTRQIGGTQPSAGWWFDIENNIWKYKGVVSRWLPIANCDVTSGVISNFNAKETFQAPDIQDVVRKSGDTIEGQLTVKGSHGGILAIQNSNIDLTTVPSSHQYMGIKFLDKNGTVVGTIDIRQDASTGVSHFMLGNHQSDGIYSVTPAKTDSSTKIATTAFVKNVLSSSGAGLATISKAANGYCKFNNGLIIQWGTVKTTSDTSATWTFATAFTSTNYRVVSNYLLAQDGNYSSTVSNKSTTNCKIWANNQTVECIAIGY